MAVKRKECALCEKVHYTYVKRRKELDPDTNVEHEVTHHLTSVRYPLFRTDRQLARHILKVHSKTNRRVIDAANATLDKCRAIVKAARKATHNG